MELYEKLYQLRKKSGFTQSELAEKLGISRQTVSNWELGTSVPPSKRLIEISKLYQVPIDYLFNEPKAEPLDTSSLDKSILSTEHSTEPPAAVRECLGAIAAERRAVCCVLRKAALHGINGLLAHLQL